MQTCPRCGQQNPEGARFCNACAAALATETREQREERKVVTALFCDLVGFTARAERLDPEDVRALLAPYHERLRSELERFGGTVEKCIGDAVMALFGAPVAHEDDPERAVRAALAIRDAIVEEGELEIRIGLTTGEALIALGARPEAGEGMASGDVVNIAARLETAAPVNGVLVDETTYRATQRAVEYREARPVEAKGKADPIPVWEALEPTSQFGIDLAEQARSPLIGRSRELELLVSLLARVREERAPQLVTLVGVAGMGKSRRRDSYFKRLVTITVTPAADGLLRIHWNRWPPRLHGFRTRPFQALIAPVSETEFVPVKWIGGGSGPGWTFAFEVAPGGGVAAVVAGNKVWMRPVRYRRVT